jgi:hypothetical protein
MLGFFPPPWTRHPDLTVHGAMDFDLSAYHGDLEVPRPYIDQHAPSHGWIRECAEIEKRRSARFDDGRREGLDA